MITLQFVEDTSIFDQVIKLYSHGWTTHVDTVWPPEYPSGEERLLGARLDGVKIRPLDYIKAKRIERVTLSFSDEQSEIYHKFLTEQIGKPYDETAILAFAFGRDWRADGHWFCSELLAAGLERSRYFPILASPANRITPADLWLLVCAFEGRPHVRRLAA